MNRRRALQLAAGGAVLSALPHRGASAQPSGTPGATPASSDLGALLRPLIEDAMAAHLVPGAVVLVSTPQGEFFEAFGTRVLGEDVPVTTGDYVRIGSNTKTMTGTVVLQLVDEGVIALDDSLSRYRPDVPNGENMRVSQLLDMSTGLFNYSSVFALNQVMDANPARAWDPEELVAIGLAEPVYFPPGEGFVYSNTNTVLAGLIAEQVTGQPLAVLFEERLFRPLGLARILLPEITDGSLPDPHPNGYWYGTNVSTIATTALSADDQAAAHAGDLLPNDITDLNPSWAWAAGAGIATAADLAGYVEALVGGAYLSPEVQATRLASLKATSDAPGAAAYGLALAKFGPMIGHDGSLPGFSSFMGHDPETGNTLIVFSTLQDSPAGVMTANEIARPIIGTLAGR
jgi:D-alanyl-D-alanine carboxypeptidase